MLEIPLIEMCLRETQCSEPPGFQVVVLGEIHGSRSFPIFIGPHEMEALDHALHGATAQRPLTHDLILNTIEALGGELARVIVDDLRAGTFFGKLGVRLAGGAEALVDTRPSDAMVLAAKQSVPIFVAEHVLEAIERQPDDEE